MKKGKKRIRRVLLILVPTIIIMSIVAVNLYPLLLMNPTETGNIPDTNVIAINDGMNSIYLVKTGSGYILFDAGSNMKRIESTLNNNDINVDDIKWIFLSHSDSDHTSALPLFPNAKIHMSENEIPLINGTVKRNLFSSNSVPIDIDDIICLNDEQSLLLNNIEVKCISVPGHTNGSMVYLVDEEYLFIGDAFKYNNGKLRVHPFTMDKTQSLKSIEMLRGIIQDGELTVFTSHYSYFTSDNLS
jgi:glyoxylase-like metal-dependent hydrolase (beta-lactamase superfamily II)